MGKNILIFADGTGNEGGLLPDESRTNVYKLFRATRTGPDSPINPAEQIAFYIPGVGTSTPGEAQRLPKRLWRGLLQAVGGGLTRRVIDGYVAIISVWAPGDRIYLFGFSRGAYIARCIANVLECAGIPTRQADGKPLSLEPGSLRALAKEGVRTRYSLGLPKQDVTARDTAAAEFRDRYASAVGVPPTGPLPYFVGAWDTVAALGWNHFLISWLIRKIRKSDHPFDMHFPKDVPYARHAMAIDEYRKDFVRVPWGGSGTVSYDDLDGLPAHQYIPTGGYGMNTGVGDACDLGWKLAAVLTGFGGRGLLASYDVERRPVGWRNCEASKRHSQVRAEIAKLYHGDLMASGADGDAEQREGAAAPTKVT
jgi:Uncharacterized alpha/beta hydrolase domain (DUF2235)/FAD binding domain